MTPNNYHTDRGSHQPFWNPWGAGGCLWRSILFLLGLFAICFLLAVLYRIQTDQPSIQNPFHHPVNPFNPAEPPLNDPYKDIRNNQPVDFWNDSIPGVDELPDPERNYIPPVDSTRIIPDPTDSLAYIVQDELSVFFNSNDLKKDMADFARQFKQHYPSENYSVKYYNPTAGTMLLGVPQQELLQVAEELPQKIQGINFYVATNEILEESGTPSDPGFQHPNYDAYYKLIQAYDAWDVTKGSREVVVGIVDSYFDLSHPEIGDRYLYPIHIPSKTGNVYPPAKDPTQENMTVYCHGSHVAGIAIGAQNNQLACSGIAPECSWIPVSLGNQLTSFNIMEGLLYAIYRGADVVNFSLGRMFPDEAKMIPLEEQIKIATKEDKRGEALWNYIIQVANERKCVLVTAAGNSTVLMGLDPKARNNEFIKVEAVDSKGQMAPFSNFGRVPEVGLSYSTVSAPGVDIWSVSEKRCTPLWKQAGLVVSEKESLQEMSGTSMASPVVAGAVALLKSKNKELSTDQIIKILKLTSKQTDPKHRIGPTIQIKDALDATGGDALNFDDLMKNHDLLIGKWRSTKELTLTKMENDEKVDDNWTYFIFTSTSKGMLEIKTINTQKTYRAPLSVSWSKDNIKITQHGNAISDDGDEINKDDFVCHPNKERLLETSVRNNGKERYVFLLEKVN